MAPSCRWLFGRGTSQMLGHKSSKTAEIYTHVVMKDLRKIKSPLDLMRGGKNDIYCFVRNCGRRA